MRTLPAALVCVLLAGDSLHAQRSPDTQWRGLQGDIVRGYRVTVRTATGKASGILRAVEPDRLIFGDRASKPMIVARSEICDVSTSRFGSTPRDKAHRAGDRHGRRGRAQRARFGKVGLLVTLLGVAVAYDRNVPGPSYPRYANPDACPP